MLLRYWWQPGLGNHARLHREAVVECKIRLLVQFQLQGSFQPIEPHPFKWVGWLVLIGWRENRHMGGLFKMVAPPETTAGKRCLLDKCLGTTICLFGCGGGRVAEDLLLAGW